MTEPEPHLAERIADAGHLSEEASEDYDRKGDKERHDAGALALRFGTPDERCEEQVARNPRRRDPENGGLQMPRPGEAVGEEWRESDTVESTGFHAGVRHDAAQQRLRKEQNCNDREIES
jgi:hypothetical protein